MRYFSTSFVLLILSVFTFAGASPLHAQSGKWESLHGPDGGGIGDIVTSPDGGIYVLSNFDYYYSASSDFHFRLLFDGSIQPLLQSIAIDSNGNTYGASGSLVCRMNNGVVDFNDTLGSPFTSQQTQLRVLPGNIPAATVGKSLARYVGGSWHYDTLPVIASGMVAKADTMFAVTNDSIYIRIGNGGWSTRAHHLDISVRSVEFSPWGILVGTFEYGVLLSAYPYDTLISLSDYLPDWQVQHAIYADGCILAGTANNLYTSCDLGNTWISGNGRLRTIPVPNVATRTASGMPVRE